MLYYLLYQVVPLFINRPTTKIDIVNEMEKLDVANTISVTTAFVEGLRTDEGLPVRSAAMALRYALKDLQTEVDAVYEDMPKRRSRLACRVRGNVYDLPKSMARIRILVNRVETRKRMLYDVLMLGNRYHFSEYQEDYLLDYQILEGGSGEISPPELDI